MIDYNSHWNVHNDKNVSHEDKTDKIYVTFVYIMNKEKTVTFAKRLFIYITK